MSKQNSSVLVVGKTIYRRITEFINQGEKHRSEELGILESHVKYSCNIPKSELSPVADVLSTRQIQNQGWGALRLMKSNTLKEKFM